MVESEAIQIIAFSAETEILLVDRILPCKGHLEAVKDLLLEREGDSIRCSSLNEFGGIVASLGELAD